MLQMIRKALMYMILSFIFWFFTGSVFAGISLIQSFEEINITGDFYFNVSVSDAGDVNND